MSTENKDNSAEKTSKREQAINLSESHGQKINHQVKDKQEIHQPRDHA